MESEKMDSSQLYRTQLFFIKLFGFPLDYQIGWRGNLMKFYTICIALSNLFTIMVLFHYIVLGNYTIEDFSDAFGCFYAVSETFLKLVVFYKWRHKFKKLFSDMESILSSGNSMSSFRFGKITKIGQNLTKMYLVPAILTPNTYMFGALYKMFANSEKILPYKAR